jgi:hypothetical protein
MWAYHTRLRLSRLHESLRRSDAMLWLNWVLEMAVAVVSIVVITVVIMPIAVILLAVAIPSYYLGKLLRDSGGECHEHRASDRIS